MPQLSHHQCLNKQETAFICFSQHQRSSAPTRQAQSPLEFDSKMSIPVVLLFAWHAMADNQGYPMGSPPYGLGFWINLAQTGTNGVSLGIPQSNAFNSNANAFGPNGNPMGPYGSSAGPNEGIGVFPTIQYGTASYRPGVCNLNVS